MLSLATFVLLLDHLLHISILLTKCGVVTSLGMQATSLDMQATSLDMQVTYLDMQVTSLGMKATSVDMQVRLAEMPWACRRRRWI